MRRTISRVVFAVFVCAMATPATAQDGGRVEVGLGYSFVGIIEEDAPVSYTHLTLPTNREV